jgi:hypothetical protein
MKIARIFDSPCVLKRRRPSASHVLAFGDRVLRSEIRPGGAARASVDRLVAKSPQYRDDKRHWLKATPHSPNNAWLAHSSLVHRMAWH